MTCPTAGLRRIPSLALSLAIAVGAAAGCGKKGPPLAPLVLLPAAPDQAVARARGDVVAFQSRVPEANADGTRPADVARVEVYAYTGVPASDADLLKLGTRVAAVPVQPPRDPEDEEASPGPGSATAAPGTFRQAEIFVVRERLGEAERAAVIDPRQKKLAAPQAPEVSAPLQPPLLTALPSRLYASVAVSRRGRRGPLSEKLRVPLTEPPSPPPAAEASHDEKSITVRWAPAPGVHGPTIAPVARKDAATESGKDAGKEAETTASTGSGGTPPVQDDPGILPAKAIGMPAVSGGYNVYLAEEPATEAQGAAEPAQRVAVKGPLASPLNATPLVERSFQDPALEFGRERCYVVRAVSILGDLSQESAASPPACITPADTFPPARPAGLAAVASEGAISLIWEGNSDADLQGYLVLRAEGGGELRPLTADPINETTYRDAAVKAGTRYTYALVAVDKAGNRSEPSARVEETAR